MYYIIMNVLGFSYVNKVTLNNERRSHFKDNHQNFKSFVKTLVVWTLLLFFVSTNVCIRSNNDFGKYSFLNVARYNCLYFCTFYFLGLQFTHLDKGDFQRFMLKWQIMITWSKKLWLIFVGFAIILLAVLLYVLLLYNQIGLLKIYGIAILCGLIAFLLFSRIYR